MKIREFELSATAGAAEWQAFMGLVNGDNREQVGGPQWDQDPETLLRRWQSAKYSRCRRWLAWIDGEPVGCAFAWWETRDDPDLVMVYVVVAPGCRRRGVGAALAARMREALEGGALRRAIVEVNTLPRSEEPLAAPGGAGAVDGAHPGVRMALSEGFTLGQAAIWSRYDLHGAGVDPQDALSAAQEAAGDDYALTVWEGAAEEHLLPELARLKERMRADMPAGALEFGESRWDEERMREEDERRLAGNRLWRAVVRHRPTGEVVALNELLQNRGLPDSFVGQWDTVVLPEHRGHRLGMLVKAANILQVRGAVPAGVEINTCNAAENTHMLAINRELGFREYLWAGTFQLATCG